MTTSIDTRLVIIALTTTLGRISGDQPAVAPLSPSEWSRLWDLVARSGVTMVELVGMTADERLRLCRGDAALASRVAKLLERVDLVRTEMRDLEQRGIWLLTRIDPGYSARWRDRLGATAPPTLFGNGNPESLNLPSLGIVGSRDISPELARVADDLGAAAEYGPFVVVSGGARGADRCGMEGVLEVGGRAVAIVPDHLQRDRLRRANLDEIGRGRLTMVSVVHPDTGFSVGNAMARNRLIYALSDVTFVVSTSGEGGGTWAGATANLKSRWAPLAVWTGEHAPVANRRLVELGGYPFERIPRSRLEFQELVRAATDHANAARAQSGVQLGIPGFPV